MKESPSSSRRLSLLLIANLLALPLLSLVISQGWLDALSQGGRVTGRSALLAIWIYGSLSALVLAWLRFRPPLVKVATAAFSVALCLLVLEVGGRLLRIPQGVVQFHGLPSKRLHHVMPASQYMYEGRYDDIPVFVQTNEDGLRSAYSREDFLKFRTRIALLGDSYTFGFGVPGEASYPARLEALLRDAYPELDIAVLNAGNISYSPILEARQMEQVVSAYEPHLVLLTLDLTDIGDDHKYARVLRTGAEGETFDVPEARGAPFYGVLYEVLGAPLLDGLAYPFRVIANRMASAGWIAPREVAARGAYYEFEVVIGDVVEKNRFFIYRHPLELTRPYFEATLGHIVAASESAQRHGAAFALVVPPRFQHWNPKEAPENWEAADYARVEPHQLAYRRFFQEARERVDFPVIDLLPDYRASDEYPLVFRQDPHWNVAGHDFAARTVLRHLKALGLVGPGGVGLPE